MLRARPRFPRTAAASALSPGVVEDETESAPRARAQHAHAMAHGRDRPAAARWDRTIAGGEDEPLALGEDGRGRARLRPWPLLDGDELAARVVHARPVETDYYL